MSGRDYGEAELKAIARAADANTVPALVETIRQQQRELDNLRLSLDVARKDREELRVALLEAREALRRAREAPPT